MNMINETEKDIYRRELLENFLPFWNKAVDRVLGGVYTCFDNSGAKLLSKDKYTWSQGRFLWMWSRLAEQMQKGLLRETHEANMKSIEADCACTAAFLLRKAFLPGGEVVFLLTETGEPKASAPGAPLSSSIYADCFVSLGFSEYGRVFMKEECVLEALKLYRSIVDRIERGAINTDPYPIPPGCSMHGVPMIAMYTGTELGLSLAALGLDEKDEVINIASKYAKILEKNFFIKPHNAEMIGPASMADTLLFRHLTPGHTVECLWFYIHFLDSLNREQSAGYTDPADSLGRYALEHGWDEQYGGIFRYVDREGGKPHGRLTGDPLEKTIIDSWDTKLWWVHSESLYFSALMAKRLNSEYWQNWYRRIYDYTFRVFPNPDKQTGEWIQIRMRDNTPLNKVVALPVKDPYHIFRNFMLMLEL
jgi:N-acylglucosamine 2-epimerase